MASSSQSVSASLSSTEPSSPRLKYDVFLSFRGEETRKGIAFEIYDGLKNRGGIKTFMDEQELQVGAPISPSLLKAIEESRFAIIVLSQNYASSSWCLEELTKIVDCMKDENRILPLFYHVEPSDVRHQKRSFELAFNEHEEKSRHAIEKLKKWRDALNTVASFSGWHTQNYKTERELVQAIVESVCNKVGCQVGSLADYNSSHQNLALRCGRKEFSNDLPQEVCLLSTGHYNEFHSRNSIVTNVMDELRNPYTEMILVYGIGGVGKTTIVEEVLRKAKHDDLFDDVVMVRDVKQNPDLLKIQKEIATKLGLKIDENHTLAERAPKLGYRIKGKRTLVVLDDVWEQIDLLAIGLPRLVTCKLVLTCRSRRELSMDMRTQKDIPIDILNEEEAWSLFEKMAGDVVKDSRIRSVAIEVAKKCGGLPVLIVTVARALKDRNKLHAWNDTLRRLSGFDKKELTKKAYLALEWSYEQLEEKELKPLFLLCGIIVIENNIYLEDLFKYGMGLGFFKNVNTIKEARDLLGSLVEKLIDSCLLLETDWNKYCRMHVRMHDLVCEVASQIASRDQHVLSVGNGDELKQWPDKDFFKRCSKMSLEASNIPMLSEVPWECPKLNMFSFYDKGDCSSSPKSVKIPSNFFSEMEKLKVLALTNLRMWSLPSSLQFLKNLQTLCLEKCSLGEIALVGHLSNLEILSFARSNIKQLPKEIGQLFRLRWLDLSDCEWLRVISPDVISRLERLEVLTMRNSFHNWEAKRGGSNASLLELKLLSQLTALEIWIPNADILPTNLFSNKLVRYQIYIGYAWKDEYEFEKTTAEMTLNTLKLELTISNELDQGLITLLKGCEDLSLDGTESGNIIGYQSDIEDFQQLKHLHLQNYVGFTHMIHRKFVFPNLTNLSIYDCDDLEFLFSNSMAKSLVELKDLEVCSCKIMEEIVSRRGQSNEETVDNMFRKLKSIVLVDLPNLARFCTSETAVQNCLFDAQVKFPSLEKLYIGELRNLQTIWNNQLADQDSFCRLGQIDVFECNSLMNVFVPIMMGRLNALETLHIEYCDSLEVVFEVGGTNVEEGLETTPPQFLFPKVTSVKFYNMPKLSMFYPEMHTSKWPLLNNLMVYNCDKVKMFAAQLPIFGEKHKLDPLIEQCLFLIDKDSFPNLENLTLGGMEIWYGPSPAHFFSKLKSIRFLQCVCTPFSKQAALLFLHQLPNLDTLEVGENWSEGPKEIFVNEVEMNSGGEMEICVKHLKIERQGNLLQLGNYQNYQAGPLFPNLDTLRVYMCKILKSVESSAVSFRNLTTLQVWDCEGLEYLTSYSVAKSLMQLTTLGVSCCERLREIIVASNEDDHCEIAFSRLQHLTLHYLPRLQGFCSGNCIVKLPSSTKLQVTSCPIELEISSRGVLLCNSKVKTRANRGEWF